MEYVEEFELNGKNFVCVDFSGLETDRSYIERVEQTVPAVVKYPESSVYLVANLENVRFDSNTKKITADYIMRVRPYLKHAAVFGADGIKKLMILTAMKLGGKINAHFTFTKEEAIEWLLSQK